MTRLMGYLAGFGSFFSQGEVLCTRGLTFLLQNPEVRKAFSEHFTQAVFGEAVYRAPKDLKDLVWKAEAYQKDVGKCDLEGSANGRPVVKIEAKLGARLEKGQLISYMGDLQRRRGGGGLLLVLVPRHRAYDGRNSLRDAFSLNGDGPWPAKNAVDCSVAVIFWEDVLNGLSKVQSEPFRGDLAQFQAMYRVLTGSDIKPITSNADLLRWRETESDYANLVDRVTRRLANERGCKVLPMGRKGKEPNDYNRRYVCLPLGGKNPCFSIGTHNPFDGHEAAIWMRFHRVTPEFLLIRDRLLGATLSQPLVESGGHVWIPLDRLANADGASEVNHLVAQAEEVISVAYQPLD